MTSTGRWVNFGIMLLGAVTTLCLAAFFGCKWLTTDGIDRSYECGAGTRGGAGTCYSGETANMTFTLIFGGVALLAIGLCVWIATSRERTE